MSTSNINTNSTVVFTEEEKAFLQRPKQLAQQRNETTLKILKSLYFFMGNSATVIASLIGMGFSLSTTNLETAALFAGLSGIAGKGAYDNICTVSSEIKKNQKITTPHFSFSPIDSQDPLAVLSRNPLVTKGRSHTELFPQISKEIYEKRVIEYLESLIPDQLFSPQIFSRLVLLIENYHENHTSMVLEIEKLFLKMVENRNAIHFLSFISRSTHLFLRPLARTQEKIRLTNTIFQKMPKLKSTIKKQLQEISIDGLLSTFSNSEFNLTYPSLKQLSDPIKPCTNFGFFILKELDLTHLIPSRIQDIHLGKFVSQLTRSWNLRNCSSIFSDVAKEFLKPLTELKQQYNEFMRASMTVDLSISSEKRNALQEKIELKFKEKTDIIKEAIIKQYEQKLATYQIAQWTKFDQDYAISHQITPTAKL